jgi:predicted lipoprotein with Yx(FWY)xxD motif
LKRLALALIAFAALSAPVAAGAAAPAAKPTLTVRSSAYGKILFDGRGFVLYAFTKDAKNRSNCFGDCARAWPPYIARGALRVGSGLDQAKLGTTKRPDGSRQVTYGGRPLYYYVGDDSVGEIRCQNVYEYGGLWLVLRGSSALVR